MQESTLKRVVYVLNGAEFAGIALILLGAFFLEFKFDELPCPLCLLQRIGFLGIAFGLLLNLRFGFKPAHYTIVMLSALFTSFVALRQISLHIVPGTGHYGDPVLGYHLYTWSFIVCMIVIAYTSVVFSFSEQFINEGRHQPYFKRLSQLGFIVIILLALSNAVATFMECGSGFCPENPTDFIDA